MVCLPQDHCSGDPGCHRQPSPGLVHPPLGGHLAGWFTERSNPFQQERNHLPNTGEENRPIPCPPPSCLLCPLGLIRSEEAARLLSEARPQAKDLGVKKPAGCLELRTAWVRQAGSPVGGARSAWHGVSRGGAQGSLWRCSGSVALRPSPPATDRSRVPCFGRRILSQEVPELL